MRTVSIIERTRRLIQHACSGLRRRQLRRTEACPRPRHALVPALQPALRRVLSINITQTIAVPSRLTEPRIPQPVPIPLHRVIHFRRRII